MSVSVSREEIPGRSCGHHTEICERPAQVPAHSPLSMTQFLMGWEKAALTGQLRTLSPREQPSSCHSPGPSKVGAWRDHVGR